MNGQGFEQLMESVRWMGRHMRGEEKDGRTTQIPFPDVKTTCDKTGLSE